MSQSIIKSLLCLIILAMSLATFAQTNFLPGWYIPKNGTDTIHGLIDYKNWNASPKKITFRARPDLKNSESVLFPTSISCFGVKGEIYKNAFVEMEQSINNGNLSFLSDKPELVLESDTVFITTLIEGNNKGLYKHVSPMGKTNFYIKEADNKYTLLIYKKYLFRSANDELQQKADNRYIGQLKLYFNEIYPSKTDQTIYKEKSLIKAFKNYLDTKDLEPSYVFPKEKAEFLWGVQASLTYTDINLSSSLVNNVATNTDFTPSPGFSAGLNFEIVIPRTNKRFSAISELLIDYYNVEGNYYSNGIENPTVITTAQSTYVVHNLLFKYQLPVGKIHIFANMGMSNGYMIQHDHKMQYYAGYTGFGVGIPTDEARLETQIIPILKFEQGFVAGLGCQYKKLGVEYRFESTTGFSNAAMINSQVWQSSLFLHYRLN